MPTMTTDEVMCPKCGGRTWDNRETKTNPKAPDYKCRDRACDGVVWPPKNGAPPRAAAPAKQGYSLGGPLPGEQKETGAPPTIDTGKLDRLFALYGVCLAEAIQQADKLVSSDIGTTPEAVAAMAATIFIQANQRGLAA